MKIKAQIGMVLNLDKCLGCHTCSIPCKNAWTTAPGAEYMWFNNVETKPGIGYPREWENQEQHKGGWILEQGTLRLRSGSRKHTFLNLFANPTLPHLDDYYEPWDYNYARLTSSPPSRHQPAARPRSAITGKPFNPQWGVNWEDDLGGAHVTGLKDSNFKNMEASACLKFDQVFMLHLPRLCEHCLNPACVASCPSGAMYKRDEDGIVLVDQTRCRSWRMCVSGCPYKKVYFNWKTHHAEKCLFCYPRVEAGEPTLCAHSCTGRIRYMGVLLYDADRVHTIASTTSEQDLYEAQLSLFLDPEDPDIIREAERSGIPHAMLEAARRSPVKKLALDWRLALPLHPEFRTLPMVWYVPPTSPLTEGGMEEENGSVKPYALLDRMRIPVRYLANLMTAGDETPVRTALARLIAMRHAMRDAQFIPAEAHTMQPDRGKNALTVLESVGLSPEQAGDMYRLLALARYDERFVIPTTHREDGDDVFALKGQTGFPDSVS